MPPPGGVAPAGKLENGQAVAAVVFGSCCQATNKKKSKSVKLKVKSTFKALTCTIRVGGYTSRFSRGGRALRRRLSAWVGSDKSIIKSNECAVCRRASDSEGIVGLHADVKAKKAKGRSL